MSSSLAQKWSLLDRLIQRLRYRQVMQFIPRQCVLADLGCGNGDFLRFVQYRIKNGYGVDARVDGQPGKNLEFRVGDLNNHIPLDDGCVDVVTALAVLEHLLNPVGFLAEVFRILKPGGACVLTTPAPAAKPVLEFLAFKVKLISEWDIRDHKYYFTEASLAQLFHLFDEVKIQRFQFGLNTRIVAYKERLVLDSSDQGLKLNQE